jgi:Cu-processing system permease protein
MNTGTITRLSFHEARSRRLVLTVSILGVVFLLLFAIGFYLVVKNSQQSIAGERPEMMNFFLLTGLYVVNFLVVALTVLASVDTIAGDISSGTIQTIATKRLRRWNIILGKWLGLAAMMAVFVVGMSAAMMGIVRLIGHYVPPHPLEAIGLMVLEGLVLLTLSILGGTRLTSLANGVVVFMLYGLAFASGWMEQIAAFVKNETLARIGIVVSLIVPSESLWRRAAYLMQPPFLRQLGVGPFTAATSPSIAMVVYAGIYVLALLALACRWFQKRDL